MSDKEQTPSNVGRSAILIIAVVIIGAAWFMSRGSSDKSLDNTDKKQSQDTVEAAEKTDEYSGWKSHTWSGQGVSFKYPGEWYVSETASMGRLYVKNSQVDLLKEETPDNFQQVWLSVDTDETSAAREAKIKKGESDYREVASAVTPSTIKAGDITINIYEYETQGGPTLEAYWTNKSGKRFYATNSTQVGAQNQKDMVASLKKVLASVAFAE